MKSLKNAKKDVIYPVFTGALAGFINGMFGGGGGMLVVPLLSGVLGYDKKSSHATAILIILPFSVLSGILYASFGNAEWGVLLPVILGTSSGGILGAVFLSKFSNKTVALIFALLMAFAGAKMLFF